MLVPGSEELGTEDFCISKFEVKERDELPWSIPAGTPWTNGGQFTPPEACAALGAEFSEVNNAQWQTLARNIEGVASNWSGSQAGEGELVRGHTDAIPPRPLSVLDTDDPCDQTGNADCTSTGPSFSQRRTHALSTGSQIWDVGGNAPEWVTSSPPAKSYDGYAAMLTRPLRSDGGTCPEGTQRFTEEASHGLGWSTVFEDNEGIARGGHYAYGPLAGVFSAFAYIEGGGAFRCVKAPTP